MTRRPDDEPSELDVHCSFTMHPDPALAVKLERAIDRHFLRGCDGDWPAPVAVVKPVAEKRKQRVRNLALKLNH